MLRVDAILDHYRAPLLQRLPSWALPAAGLVVAALLVIAAGLVIGERHQRRATEAALCAAQLHYFYVRNPRLVVGRVKLAEPCVEWRAIRP